MRIAYLAAGHSIHTVRWVNAIAGRGHDVELLTMHPPSPLFPLASSVRVRMLPVRSSAGYFLNAPFARGMLASFKPDVVHAHYASGYGTLLRMTGRSPSILSVWGSDVSDFPHQSKRKAALLRRNLESADYLWATSRALKAQTAEFAGAGRHIELTPFGVDCDIFRPGLSTPPNGEFVVGIVKDLEPAYGIDLLLRAFAMLKQSLATGTKPKLVIAGGGSLRESLGKLAHDLGIEGDTSFVGPIPHERVPQLLNSFSVFAALSTSESFGVSVLEASACGIPVVVSNAGGLPEVAIDGKTGFVVPVGNVEAAFNRLKLLAEDPRQARSMGGEARRFVKSTYDWTDSVSRVENAYCEIVSKSRKHARS